MFRKKLEVKIDSTLKRSAIALGMVTAVGLGTVIPSMPLGTTVAEAAVDNTKITHTVEGGSVDITFSSEHEGLDLVFGLVGEGEEPSVSYPEGQLVVKYNAGATLDELNSMINVYTELQSGGSILLTTASAVTGDTLAGDTVSLDTPEVPVTPPASGGGGGGGGGAVTPPVIETPDEEKPEVEAPYMVKKKPVTELKKTATDTWDNWADEAIVTLAKVGVISGYDDGTFKAKNEVTRAEFAKLIATAIGAIEPDHAVGNFDDVPDKHWANKYINTLRSKKIVNGTSDSKFNPNGKLTREEALTMLERAFTENVEETESAGLKDLNKVSEWARPSVLKAVKSGLVKGYEDSTIRPQNKITRDEISTIIYRYLNARDAERFNVILAEFDWQPADEVVGLDKNKFEIKENIKK